MAEGRPQDLGGGTRPVQPAVAAVEVRGLSKSYGSGPETVAVLRGVDLSVAPGEFVAILGPSGSGKSTLLNLMGLMDRPDAGTLSLRGGAVAGASEEERAALRSRHVGFIFQFDALMPEFTVLENVLMPARIAAAAGGGAPAEPPAGRAARLLEALGVGALAARFPRQLSGGERQRAAIARALVNSPSVILADEPTGNLDRPNAELVFSKLKDVAATFGAAVVMVTHNESAVGYATRALHLRDGRIAEGLGAS